MSKNGQMSVPGLIFAYRLDGSGGGTTLDWRDIQAPSNRDGMTWIRLDLGDPDTLGFLREQNGLDEVEADVLLAEHTRPRMVPFDDALVVILRGINFNPGAEPDDMVSIRIWASERLVISCRRLRLRAVEDVQQSLTNGCGLVMPLNSSQRLRIGLSNG